jgi:hypothetical protein
MLSSVQSVLTQTYSKNPSSWSVICYRTDNRESLNFPLMEELRPTTFLSSVKNIRLRPLKFENTKMEIV